MFRIYLIILTLALCHAAPHFRHSHNNGTNSSAIVAIARLEGRIRNSTTGNESVVSGYVKFIQKSNSSMKIVVNISFVPEFDAVDSQVQRGLHIHTLPVSNFTGNPAIDCGSTGSHWNPENVTHGLPQFDTHHFGDLGNVMTRNGQIIAKIRGFNLTINGGVNSILGHSVVLHERKDDGGLGKDPTSKSAGNAGARIACSTITILE